MIKKFGLHIQRVAGVLISATLLLIFPSLLNAQKINVKSDVGVNYARQKEVTDRFVVPIESYNGFSGTYGELRGDHFHCGLDMRTNGVVGRKIYAADDGYISRITVSPWGYGNMIEITHPSGYKTIYAHLLSFTSKYKSLVLSKQYSEQSWRQYIDFPPDSLPVKRGELIAFSGNSGSSGGPHLHFEVLDENNVPVNLQLTKIFGVQDNEAPIICDIRLIGCVDMYGALYTFPIKMQGDTIKVPKSFYVAVDAYDVMAGTPGKLAVYKYEMLLDGSVYFSFTEGNIPTSTGRYIASLIDYPLRRATGRYYVKSQIDPANILVDRILVENNGVISLADSLLHSLKIEVTDVYGNSSSRVLKVLRDDVLYGSSVPFSPEGEFAAWNRNNKFSYSGLNFSIPEGALYRNAYIQAYNKKDLYAPQENVPAMSALWKIGDEDIPLHKDITISMLCNIPSAYRNKVLLARVLSGGELSGCGGSYNIITRELTATVRSFGTFCVTADITPPEVSVKLKEGATVKGNSIKATIKDRLSGIKIYRAEIDGCWVVAAFDGKTATLEIALDEAKIGRGKKHSLVLLVEDNVGNQAIVERQFVW